MIDLETAYKIADRMVKPWQWTTLVLSLTVIGLLVYILLSETVAITEINAEDLQAAVLSSVATIGDK